MIHEAINNLGYIRPEHYEKPANIGWNQCSRTDKGVHAIFNIVSCKMKIPSDNMPKIIQNINDELPNDIKVLG